jgi:hypothetical protein
VYRGECSEVPIADNLRSDAARLWIDGPSKPPFYLASERVLAASGQKLLSELRPFVMGVTTGSGYRA